MSYRLVRVESSRSSDFAAAYAALEREFATQGELEPREVVSSWLDSGEAYWAQPVGLPALKGRYQLIVARDDGGELAGVRDCHVLVDPREKLVVVYLAHAVVLEPYRRTGLGQAFRALALELGREALAREHLDAGSDLLLAAEMEPLDPEDPASIVRLVAYGKDRFQAISPAALPYFQPDFRTRQEGELTTRSAALSLLAVVRWVDHEARTSLPKRLARAFVQHLFGVFATHLPRSELHLLSQRTLDVLDAFPGTEVPLLALPASVDDVVSFEPLGAPKALPNLTEELE